MTNNNAVGKYRHFDSHFIHLQNVSLQKHNLTHKDLGWPAFMVLTSHAFAGKERCDCHRSPVSAEFTVENRYYRKVWPSGDVTLVTYFTKTAWPVHGHTLRDGPPPVLTLARHDAIGAARVDWTLQVDELLAKLMAQELPLGGAEPLPAPTVVLYNEGIWNSGEKALIDQLAKARAEFGGRGVRFQWKTTTRSFMVVREEKVRTDAEP
jgi:hypothetical protein